VSTIKEIYPAGIIDGQVVVRLPIDEGLTKHFDSFFDCDDISIYDAFIEKALKICFLKVGDRIEVVYLANDKPPFVRIRRKKSLIVSSITIDNNMEYVIRCKL